jgi:hypothetical protein
MANIHISETILGKIKKPKGQVLDEIAAAVKKALGLDVKEIEMHIKEAAPPKVQTKEMEGKSLIRKTRVEFVNPDLSRKPEDGWMGFHIRWLIDDVSMGATQGTLGYAFSPPGPSIRCTNMTMRRNSPSICAGAACGWWAIRNMKSVRETWRSFPKESPMGSRAPIQTSPWSSGVFMPGSLMWRRQDIPLWSQNSIFLFFPDG